MEKDNRIITLTGEVNDVSSLQVIAELLHHNSEDNQAPIYLYINSNGGDIDYGLGIYDTIQHIEAPVYTVCTGFAASMGAFLLSCGEKGHRSALKHSRILIHQPLISGSSRYAEKESDLRNKAESLLKCRNILEKIMADNANQPLDIMHKACERDNWMSAEEALAFGLIDEII